MYEFYLLSYLKSSMSHAQNHSNTYSNILFCIWLFFIKNSGNHSMFSIEISIIPFDGCGVLCGVEYSCPVRSPGVYILWSHITRAHFRSSVAGPRVHVRYWWTPLRSWVCYFVPAWATSDGEHRPVSMGMFRKRKWKFQQLSSDLKSCGQGLFSFSTQSLCSMGWLAWMFCVSISELPFRGERSFVFACSTVSGSPDGCNKLPQTWWLKTTEIYSCTVLEGRMHRDSSHGPRWGVDRAGPPSRGCWQGPILCPSFQLLLAAGIPWLVATSLQSLPLQPHCLLLCGSLCSRSVPPSSKETFDCIWGPWKNLEWCPHHQILNF